MKRTDVLEIDGFANVLPGLVMLVLPGFILKLIGFLPSAVAQRQTHRRRY